MRKFLLAGFILLIATVGFAQSTRVRGKVVDSSDLIMPGAAVKIYQGNKVVQETTTTNTGDFEVALPAGTYKVEVSAPDFATQTQEVKVAPNLAPLSFKLDLAVIATNVDVTDDSVAVSVDADSSLSATTLSGDAISELPDDDTELTNYLQQIAGSRGGADTGGGSGGFVIDGFSSGNLPPKDQIQEIRINNNPYSTEFSGIGFGRVEIITKAGTGNFNGNMQFNYKDARLDAANPFALGFKAPYQTKNFNSNYGGPIIKNKLTMNFRVNNNENENGNTIHAILPTGGTLDQPTVSPNVNRGFNTRGQYALTKNNTLNFNYNYNSGSLKNFGLNEFTLPEYASDRTSNNYEVQFRETALLNSRLVHETRFEIQHNVSSTTPRSNNITINVLSTFVKGGSGNRNSSNNYNYELSNLLMYSGTKWTAKAGFQINRIKDHTENFNNFQGTYQFANLGVYPASPTIFTQNSGNPVLDSRQVELGSFWQNDWKFSNRFTFSAGVRYETQTNIDYHKNIDPRIGFALGLTKTSLIRGGAGIFHQRLNIGNVETLLRGDGTRQLSITIPNPGFSFDASGNPIPPAAASSAPTTVRVRDPLLVSPYNENTSISLEKSWPHGLGTTFSWDTTRGVHLFRSRNINAPYPGTPLPASLLADLASNDPTIINCSINGQNTTAKACALERVNRMRPLYPYVANVLQLESTGKLWSNNFNVGFRGNVARLWGLQMFGSYGLGTNKTDTDGAFSLPMNSYDMSDEWGRSSFDTRHRFNTGVNFRIPAHSALGHSSNSFASSLGKAWDTAVGNSYMLINAFANSARPYNITTGTDLNGDTTTNDRPAGFKRYAGVGASSYNVNLNFNKQFNLRHEQSGGNSPMNRANPYASSYAEPQRGGGFPGGGFPGGGGPGRGGPGGPGGGPGGPGGRGGPNGMRQPQGPTITFIASINNLLNNVQLQNFNGVLGSNAFPAVSPIFGKATSARSARSINLGMRFNF